ncbi:MAG: sigma-70 family RNA polymerase sigma factor, partial [Kiritimatiellia bacterium]|nr:sigma-70 family RNA polymerase sigma factor [Kiritimatiellia bacterium]
IGEADGSTFGDIIGDDQSRTPYDEINDRQLLEEISRVLHHLDHREREILKYRYGLEGQEVETLDDVGKRFGITRERVRQIQNQSLLKLRATLEEVRLPDAEGEES